MIFLRRCRSSFFFPAYPPTPQKTSVKKREDAETPSQKYLISYCKRCL